VLRRISGSKTEEEAEGWRRLHKEDRNLDSLQTLLGRSNQGG
jgi:hypothetical protein